jgi:hypothetical protein
VILGDIGLEGEVGGDHLFCFASKHAALRGIHEHKQ